MAWIGRVFGAGVRGTRGDRQSHRWVSYLHATTPSAQSTPLLARSRIPTHSTCSTHRRWIHSSQKSHEDTTLNATNSAPTAMSRKQRSDSLVGKGSHLLRNVYIWTPEIDAKILEMRLEGNSWHEIGAAIGRDHSACHQRYLKELDPALHKQWNPEKLERLNVMVADGRNWRYISEKLLITQSICREKWMSMNQDLVQKAKEIKKLERPRAVRPVREPGASTVETYRMSGMLAASKYRWCTHVEALLLELRDRGLNWRQIGSVFGMVPMSCYLRYQHRLRSKLKSGWTPLKIDISNVPYYLLPQRVRPLPSAPKIIATASTDLILNNATSSAVTATKGSGEFIPWLRTKHSLPKNDSVPAVILGVLSDDFSYDMREPVSSKTRTWTPEEDKIIITGREQGASFKTIGERLKLDPRICHSRYYTALEPKMREKEWTPASIEKLRFYVQQGLAWSTIANELGFHRVVCREKYLEISRSSEQSTRSSESRAQQDDTHSTSSTAITSGDTVASKESDMEDDHDLEDRGDDMLEDDYGDSDDDNDDGFYDGDNDSEDDDNDGDDDDEDVMSMNDAEDGEENESTTVVKGSRQTKQKTPPISTPTVWSIWDQELFMRERQKLWTTTEETTLIQHVIRNGIRSWDEIAETLGGAYSAEECRAYWKFLDMPVIRHNRQPSKWSSQNEALFWVLWLEKGFNYEEIARTLTESYAKDDAFAGNTPVFEAKDCESLFTARTRHLQKGARAEEEGGLDEAQLQKEYVEIALAQSKKPAPPFKWTKEKSVTLQKIIRQRLKTRGVQFDWINWRWVARHVGGGATAQRCNTHWRALRKAEMDKDVWTNEEVLLLEKGIREVGTTFNDDGVAGETVDHARSEPTVSGFRAIQRFYLPNHGVDSLQRKYFLLSDKATEVTVQEYMAILEAVEEYGESHWDKVVKRLRALPSSSSATGSTLSSMSRASAGTAWTKAPCRRVWESSYKHSLLYTPWSAAEDLDLRESVEHLGKGDWTLISRFFPGKSSWQCRLRWCQITDPHFQPSSFSSSSSSSDHSSHHPTTS
ncbi:Myblike DNAbinding domain-containing protein [Haplosporangium gracile]|nr:Myblike DNAbinding domain-containing protein [Haplosporangium gracile]